MNCAPNAEKQQKFVADILHFMENASGLRADVIAGHGVRISQAIDNKSILIAPENLADVLVRSDVAGEEFIQVNFLTGQKILLTDTLIGFKPSAARGLDATRIPRVVTTPDVVNVFEAIQDALHLSGPDSHEVSILKKIFDAVLTGGEAVGFDLSPERTWVARISATAAKYSS